MTTFNVFFVNKYSEPGKYQDYAFFSDLPKLAPNPTGAPIYSNVFQSTTLTRDEDWSIGMTNTYYAWCGTSDKNLASNAKVDRSMSKLVTLGTELAPGSTLKMANKAGQPIFKPTVALTASAGSFGIETGNDFNGNANLVYGYGATDDEGKLKLLATLDAPTNTTVNIVPATKFYIAAHSSSVGTVIDASEVSKNAAAIDFTKNTGMYGAIVTHEANSGFSVKYTTQADFTKAVEVASEPTLAPITAPKAPTSTEADPRDIELAQLRQQIQQMQIQLYAALNSSGTSTPTTHPTTSSDSLTAAPLSPVTATLKDPYPVKAQSIWYKATLPFRNAPGQSRRRDIRDRLTTQMQSRGYTYEGGSIDSNLVAMFSHDAGCYGAWHSLHQATSDWSEAILALPRHLKQYIDSEGKIATAQESRGLWRANSSGNVNGVNGVRTSSARHERDSSNGSVKALTNGVNGSEHKRESSRGSAKPLTNGVKAVNGINGIHTANGVNGTHHDRSPLSSTQEKKPFTNGTTAEAVKPVNGINGVNGVGGRYDYPHGVEDPVMKAKKMRARQMLIDEGLEEYAGGWMVGGS